MRVYEITIEGDTDKDAVTRLLCQDEDHAPPCPVPWSVDSVGAPLVVSVCVDTDEDASALVTRLRAATGLPVTAAGADPGAHETLVEQYRIERGLRA